MSDPDQCPITQILLDLEARPESDERVDHLFKALYGELRSLASGLMKHERSNHTLQATALVHEAYVRLVDGTRVNWRNRAHFFGVAARVMRQILVDHARARAAEKRGGAWRRVSLHDGLAVQVVRDPELLDLDRALNQLAEHDPRMAGIVELRVFGGLKMTEIAHMLDLSRQTVQEEWKVARMWLRHQLAGGDET